ncbi:hypothetical protein CFK38_03575 [Brachybacterium vulturis]|uniref:Uncharacterized protein n=1 Tax=Brachybacterium vulturis TaxID=2017484 RepID=A0A291GKF1_9MICO|nr:hypothetical protein CFK38_03575 [Brachybacterium vulturis]
MRPAIALAIISLLTVLMAVVGVALVTVLAATGLFEDAEWGQDLLGGQGFAVRLIAVMLLSLAVIAVTVGTKLAAAILGIIVVIKGDGKLRIGASLLLAVALMGLFFSFSMDGSMLSGTFESVLSVLATLAQLVQWGVSLAGIVILGLGIREVRRARAGYALDLR